VKICIVAQDKPFHLRANYVLDFGTIGPNVTFEYKSSAKPHLLLIEGEKY
jgi:hypothetical protein